jgi:two-component sensor histidine kinase
MSDASVTGFGAIREFIEKASDAIVVFALSSGEIIIANAAAREAFGLGGKPRSLRVQDILPSMAAVSAGQASFIQKMPVGSEARHYEVKVDAALIAGERYGIAVARDETEALRVEGLLRKSLADKDTLVNDIHHRVKNNFQLLRSIISLQAASIEDEGPRLLIFDIENRIMSMASAYERLYLSPSFGLVPARGYFGDIVSSLRANYGESAPVDDIVLDCADVELPIDIALPCGLIVNELLCNCVKHAFLPGTSRERNKIAVSLSVDGAGGAEIMVSDNGSGIDEGKLVGEARTMGLILVRALSDQIKGKASWRRDGGTKAAVTFPLQAANAPKPRGGSGLSAAH